MIPDTDDGAGDDPALTSGSDLYAKPLPDPALGSRRSRGLALLALVLLVPAPSVGVALAMMIDSTQGTLVGKGAYFLSKVWILALPLVWTLWAEKGRVSWSPARKGGFGIGAGLGVLISAAIFAGWWVVGRNVVDAATVHDAAVANGIGSPWVYLGFVAYLALVNSLLEEYVWRWFVFRQSEKLVGGPAAVVCSAMFFTIHHVLALKAQMGWTPTILASSGVFIGGAAWSWCYLRFRSIWPGYVSHLIVDAAVFVLGWWLIFGGAK